MAERNSLRRVQFPEAGEGVELYLANSGTRALFAKFGEEYFTVVEKGLLFGNFDVIETCLAFMPHDAEGKKVKVDIDDLDSLSLQDLQDRLLDTFCLSANGRTYREQVAWIQAEALKQASAAERPPTAPEDTSATSGDEPSEQASIPPNSTL